jgi:hypothetical protein
MVIQLEAIIIWFISIPTRTYTYPCMHLSILKAFYVLSYDWNKGAKDPFDWIGCVIICQQLYMSSLCVQKNFNRNFTKSPLCKMPVSGCMLLHNKVWSYTTYVCTFPIVARAGREYMRGHYLGQKVNTAAHSTLQGSLNIIPSTCYHYITHHNPNCFQLLIVKLR